MKICIINNLYPPNARGGAEQVVSKTVEGLVHAGHDVVVITTTPDGDWSEANDQVTIYRFKPRNIYYYIHAHKHNILFRFMWHVVNMFHVGAARHVKKILQIEKPDVVHTHNLMGLSFLIPRIIKQLGLRHLHTVHDVQLVEPSGVILKSEETSWRYNGFPTKIYSWITRTLFGSPDVVISPSQFLLDFYSSRNFFKNSPYVVVRNPIPFDFSSERHNLEKGEKFRLLYVGQIEHHKGIVFLAEVFSSLTNIDAELHIVGNGSLFDDVKKIANDNEKIHAHGRLNRQEVASLFQQSDMTIVPSRCYENSPTVIFESFYFGVPVLASRIEGIAELIREGENGVTFVADDKESLKEKILWCTQSKTHLENMAKKTRDSLRGLSEGEYVERLLSHYKNN